MITHVIFACMTILSAALIISAFRMRNLIKNENPDKLRATLFLHYDIFKRTNLYIIDGSIIVFFVQVMNIITGIQDMDHIFRQVMPVVNMISMLIIGYILVHMIHTMSLPKRSSTRSGLERCIFGDDRR